MGILYKQLNTNVLSNTYCNSFTDKQLYAKHDAEKHDAEASAAIYEDPKDSSPPQESIYELEPHSKAYSTSELVYEPLTESNIYSTPFISSKVRTDLFLG